MSEGDAQTGLPPPAQRRARYAHPLAHYVAVFGRKERALKGWIAIGRDAAPPELPPLDEPARMKDWWARHMSHRVPDEIAMLAIASAAPAAAAAAGSPDASPGPLFAAAASNAPAGPASPATSLAVGYSGALQRLREAEAAAGRLYTTLLNQAAETNRSIDDRARLAAEAERARRAWDELVNRLRPMEKDAAEILAASGRAWNADDVVAAAELVHLVLRESIFALLRRIRPKLISKTDSEQDALWQAEVDRMFAVLRENKFTAPAAAAPDAAAA